MKQKATSKQVVPFATRQKVNKKKAGQQVAFKDNRPEATEQKSLHQAIDNGNHMTAQRKEATQSMSQKNNQTGLPDQLKAGIENLSGHSMDDVKVHYNSDKPTQLQAHAYAQGTDIHLAQGQEKHLPHEAWHVVQQKQGRVKPTMLLKSKVNINDDARLEKEADMMGNKAMQLGGDQSEIPVQKMTKAGALSTASHQVAQRIKKGDFVGLAGFGLDVGSWVEFGEVLKRKDLHGLIMIQQVLSKLPWSDDTFKAMGLVRQYRMRLKKPSPSLMERQLGIGHESWMPTAERLHKGKKEDEKSIVISDGYEKPVKIHTASDLLVWLVSHPMWSKTQPAGFGESKFLTKVLISLDKLNRVVDPPGVWNAVKQVKKENALDDQDEEKESEGWDEEELDDWGKEESDGWDEEESDGWDEGDWGEKNISDPFGLGSNSGFGLENAMMEETSIDFSRMLPQDVRKREIEKIAQRIVGHKLVGVHATKVENLGPLMTEGVSDDKVESNHGAGKGRGFYIIPASVKTLDRSVKSAKNWDPHVVAVFLPEGCELVKAKDGQNVRVLEQKLGEGKYYYEFGKDEAVVPPSLFDKMVLVRDPADISVAHPGYGYPVGSAKGSQLDFLKDL